MGPEKTGSRNASLCQFPDRPHARSPLPVRVEAVEATAEPHRSRHL